MESLPILRNNFQVKDLTISMDLLLGRFRGLHNRLSYETIHYSSTESVGYGTSIYLPQINIFKFSKKLNQL